MDKKLYDDYINQYTKIHEKNDRYGTTSINLLDVISNIINFLQPRTVLDYGCGKGILVDKLQTIFPNIKFYKYDPSIKEYNTIPLNKFDFIINTDVLEHIPEPFFYNVIENIFSLSKNIFFHLHHGKAVTILPNGQNAHCTIKTQKEYFRIFKKYTNKIYRIPTRHKINSILLTFEIPMLLKKHCISAKVYEKEKVKNLFYKIFKNK